MTGYLIGMAALVVGYPFDTGDVPQHRRIGHTGNTNHGYHYLRF